MFFNSTGEASEDRQADLARGAIVHYARWNVDCLHGGGEIGLGRLKKEYQGLSYR